MGKKTIWMIIMGAMLGNMEAQSITLAERGRAKCPILWLALAVLLLLALGVMTFLISPAKRTVQLPNGATLRLLQVVGGRHHHYTPSLWERLLAMLGLKPPTNLGSLSYTFPSDEITVWFAWEGQHSLQILDAWVIDSKGAFLPVAEIYHQLTYPPVLVYRLPRLPEGERGITLRFMRHELKNESLGEIQIRLPRIRRAPPPTHTPSNLPACVRTAHFEFELQRLVVVRSGLTIVEGEPYEIWRVEPRSRFLEKGVPSQDWYIEGYWFEDPYGNTYSPGRAPPAHYPYWMFRASVYRRMDAEPLPVHQWISKPIKLAHRGYHPSNQSVSRSGLNIHLLGLSGSGEMQIRYDALSPTSYRVTRWSARLSRSPAYSVIEVHSLSSTEVLIRSKRPFLLLRITAGNLSHIGWLSGGTLGVNQVQIRSYLVDERGRIHRHVMYAFEHVVPVGGRGGEVIAAFALDALPKDVRQVRVHVAVEPPYAIRIPVNPLDAQSVRLTWTGGK